VCVQTHYIETDSGTDKQTCRQSDAPTGRHAGSRQTNSQKRPTSVKREAGRQTDRQTCLRPESTPGVSMRVMLASRGEELVAPKIVIN
jgi:hypothetical protein